MLQDIFGGILLGTGGLVRAYSTVALNAIEEATVIQKEEGYIVKAELEYDKVKEFEEICRQNNMNIIKKEYSTKVKVVMECSKEKYDEYKKKNFQKLPIYIIQNKNIIKNEK